MADFIPFQHLLCDGRDDAFPVAYSSDRIHSFAEFKQLAGQWQAALLAHPAQSVAIYQDDSLAFAAALFGAWHAGKTVCLPADDLPATREQIAKLGMLQLDALPPAEHAHAPFSPLPEESALLLFTSGTTGQAGIIAKTLRQLSAETITLSSRWDGELPKPCRVEATVSHQHIYGLLFRVLWPLAAGRPFATRRHPYPESLQAALQVAPTLLVTSPAHLKRLPHHLPWQASRPQAVFTSGGPLDDAGLDNCIKTLGQVPFEVFGSTETGGIAWRQRAIQDALAWQSFPGIDCRIENDQLAIRSPHLPHGDWWLTSDRVKLQNDGFILLGRADRIVKLEEKRVSLDALEQALLEQGLFSALRALPLPGQRASIGIAAVPNDRGWAELARLGRRAFAEGLCAKLKDRVIAEAIPRHWRYGFRLPINTQGKTTHALLLNWFAPARPHATLLSRREGEAELQIEAAAKLPDFAGHFPEFPLLPGVSQVDWSLRLARELFDLNSAFCGMNNLKFQRIIAPGSKVGLTLRCAPDRQSVLFSLHSDEHVHASGKLLFAEAAC